jgi:hypothetical protein
MSDLALFGILAETGPCVRGFYGGDLLIEKHAFLRQEGEIGSCFQLVAFLY